MYISRKYKTVTYENRCQIQEMLKKNKSITIMEVAERMNFEYSTIYREIRRGTNEDGKEAARLHTGMRDMLTWQARCSVQASSSH